MQPGIYTIYQIQARRTHQSPWRNPDGELEPVKEKGQWYVAGSQFEVNLATVTDNMIFEYKYGREAKDDYYDVQRKASHTGWFNPKHAVKIMASLIRQDKQGKFDQFDHRDNTHMQAVRHEFRLVEIRISYSESVLSAEDIISYT